MPAEEEAGKTAMSAMRAAEQKDWLSHRLNQRNPSGCAPPSLPFHTDLPSDGAHKRSRRISFRNCQLVRWLDDTLCTSTTGGPLERTCRKRLLPLQAMWCVPPESPSKSRPVATSGGHVVPGL